MRACRAFRIRIPGAQRWSLLALAVLSAPLAAQVPPSSAAAAAAAPDACCGAAQQQTPQQTPQAPTAPGQRFVLRQAVFKGAPMGNQAALAALASASIRLTVAFAYPQPTSHRATDPYH